METYVYLCLFLHSSKLTFHASTIKMIETYPLLLVSTKHICSANNMHEIVWDILVSTRLECPPCPIHVFLISYCTSLAYQANNLLIRHAGDEHRRGETIAIQFRLSCKPKG